MAGIAAACSSSPPPYATEQCADAAAVHAVAEQRWLDAVQTHALADAAAAADSTAEHEHDHALAVDAVIAARVDALIAEAATRYHCR